MSMDNAYRPCGCGDHQVNTNDTERMDYVDGVLYDINCKAYGEALEEQRIREWGDDEEMNPLPEDAIHFGPDE